MTSETASVAKVSLLYSDDINAFLHWLFGIDFDFLATFPLRAMFVGGRGRFREFCYALCKTGVCKLRSAKMRGGKLRGRVRGRL